MVLVVLVGITVGIMVWIFVIVVIVFVIVVNVSTSLLGGLAWCTQCRYVVCLNVSLVGVVNRIVSGNVVIRLTWTIVRVFRFVVWFQVLL